jgi:hypothetical protein
MHDDRKPREMGHRIGQLYAAAVDDRSQVQKHLSGAPAPVDTHGLADACRRARQPEDDLRLVEAERDGSDASLCGTVAAREDDALVRRGQRPEADVADGLAVVTASGRTGCERRTDGSRKPRSDGCFHG